MKKMNFFAALLAITVAAFAFTMANVEYKVDAQKSKVSWLGKKVTGEHKGNINIADGKLITDGKSVTGGTFNIDMNSMTCTDLTDKEYNAKLLGHLKSDDFFGTAKFPKSTLVITSVTPVSGNQYKVAGNLTIKGISKPVEFPATIEVSATEIKAAATIKVDRTIYDIRYGSGKFFESIGDKAINDEFELMVDLIAKK
jgi:polyisoprenoid-binding protein YceI